MSDHDLPTQGLLQQMNSRSVSGEHLEVLGKRAAALWSEGREKNLSDAVVSTVKTAGLSPEQVKRVVEFANTAAYLSEFHKEGSLHKVVDFGAGGLADPSVVLQDLNDGGGGSSYDTGSSEYNHPPPQTKTASVWDEAAYAQMFHTEGGEYPEANPLGEVLDLKDKLAAAYETTTSMLSSLEVMYDDLNQRLFHQVKQASLSGHSLSEIVEIWKQFAPSEDHIKVAFQAVMDPLVDNGVFRNHEEVAESLSKHASVGVVDQTHPLVVDFVDFCDVLSKMAEARGAQEELGEGVASLASFLKEAAGKEGLLQQGARAVNSFADKAGAGATHLGEKILGEGHVGARHLGTAARVGVKVAPLVVAHEGYRSVKDHPGVRRVAAAIPYTREYDQKTYENQMRWGGGQ
jgi:hypothetical protein